MKNPLSYYTLLAKRWSWVIILGIVVCSVATFTVSKIERPVYQASATLIVSLASTQSIDFTQNVEAVQTYAQLLTNPSVLSPVVAQHRGLTIQQLSAMITAKPQLNTQLIELDVENKDPRLAMQLANEVSQSFAQFSNSHLPATIQILPAQEPKVPISPKVLQNTAFGALVGLGLALALIVIFEMSDDRPASPEEVQELLGMGVLAVIPHISRKQLTKQAEEIPGYAEAYRILSANLNIAQAIEPFKLVMITSALAAEGKSTVVSNLASFLVTTGKRVLLVDANPHSPALDAYFQLDQHLTPPSAFTQRWAWIEEKLDSQLTQTGIPNLHVVTAASLGSDFTNLLQSPWASQFFEHFKKAPFDYVIFDTPPLLPVADAQVLASYVEAIVLVVDAAKVPRKVLLRVKRMLNKTRNTILAAVINKSRWAENEEIRRYLNNVQQRRTDIAELLTTPHRATPMAKPPETPTPPVNETDIAELLTTPHRATPMAMPPETPTLPVKEADITTILTILPHRAKPMAMPPRTPSVNGKADPDDRTTVVPRRLRVKDDLFKIDDRS